MIKIRRNFKRGEGRSKGANRNQKQGIPEPCEISQPKEPPCEKGLPLRNDFAAQDPSLRNQGFRCENGHPLRNHFAAQASPLAKIFTTVKRPFGTWVPFRSPTLPFSSCEMACEITFELRNGLRNGLRNWPLAAKMAFDCEITFELRNFPFAAKSPFDCEIASRLRNWLAKWEGFAKTPCEVKESCENANKAPRPCIWRGKPHAPWDHTHEASHSISDLPKPSQPIAPAESSSWGDYGIQGDY